MIRLKPNLVLPLLAPPLLALSPTAAALQVLDARDGETVLARIAQKEATRLAIAQGRIRKVTGNTGEFVLEKDEARGQVFIRPASDSAKPINLFVSTERATYALLLQPVDMPSDTLLIREARASVPSTPRSNRHVRAIKNLLLAMANDALPEDMAVRELAQELALWPGVRLTLRRAWLGAELVGESYQLTNLASGELRLAEPDLYKPGVLALSIERRRLHSGETTHVFVIRERTEEHHD